MMQKIDLRGHSDLSRSELQQILPRATLDTTKALERVQKLIAEVKNHGEVALYRHAEKFDGVTGHSLKVSKEEIIKAHSGAEQPLIIALETLIARVKQASTAQVPNRRVTEVVPGGVITQRWQPVNRVGLYVPGGKAVYPSSVVMNVVAAQTAGVKQIAIASPVQKETGGVHPTILAAAHILGIHEIYAIGGASAIAAFAYGVPEINLESVDIVTGPGNIYVAAAKRALQGVVGIDSEAGTTEILIIADGQADPKSVAADLLSQAEHDEAAASVLITDSEELLHDVENELRLRLRKMEHETRASLALGGPQSALILVDSIDQAVDVSNAYAPEHLSVQTLDPHTTIMNISDAGAIFLGNYTPVSLGDYLAGSNHVLPTGGTARFAAGLGAYTFLRPQQIVEYSEGALLAANDNLTILANAEGLPAHAAAVHARVTEQ
ncbi:MAG TPA: histidinol dehydrogenase [Microbacteriaceae bacterium]|nr:histidinol dehydrogenase [Microbacteriaceae bacterium]